VKTEDGGLKARARPPQAATALAAWEAAGTSDLARHSKDLGCSITLGMAIRLSSLFLLFAGLLCVSRILWGLQFLHLHPNLQPSKPSSFMLEALKVSSTENVKRGGRVARQVCCMSADAFVGKLIICSRRLVDWSGSPTSSLCTKLWCHRARFVNCDAAGTKAGGRHVGGE
jgi:hypothetical protein